MLRFTALALTALLATTLATGPAMAQASGGPAGNGNVYGHLPHQPAKTPVKQRERAAGIAPGHAGAHGTDRTLQSLDTQVLRQSGAPTGSARAVAPKH